MNKRVSIGVALAFAAVLTHGMVFSGIHLDSGSMPFSTYQGFFTRVLVATWGVWCQAQGLAPMSHADQYGRFSAYVVFLACPLIGFGAFLLGTRHKIGSNLWKPLIIAIAFATPLQELIRLSLRGVGLSEPMAEACRASLVLLLMIWSLGKIRIPGWLHRSMPHSIPECQ